MDRASEESRLDRVIGSPTGTTEKGTTRAEQLPPVENGVRAAIEQTAEGIVDRGESDVGPLEDPADYEAAYEKLYAEEDPYTKVGQLVVVDDALMATWLGEEWDDGMAQQIHTTGMGDTDSW